MEKPIKLELTPKERDAALLALSQSTSDGIKTITLLNNLTPEMADDNIEPTINTVRNYLSTINSIINKLENS